MDAKRERQITAICFLLAILPLLGFWTYGLFDLDEGFYAASAREMIRRGEWITPYYNGQPWFEKPILLYWLAIPSIQVFGETIGPRLPSVLCTIGTLFVTFRFVSRHVSVVGARYSLLVLGSTILMVGIGRMMLADPPLILSLTLCFTLFFDSLVEGDPRKVVGLRAWSGCALGFAVLAKGPVGALLFVLILGITYWLEPSLRSGFFRTAGNLPASPTSTAGVPPASGSASSAESPEKPLPQPLSSATESYEGKGLRAQERGAGASVTEDSVASTEVRGSAGGTAAPRGWIAATLVFLATICLWYVPAYLANGQIFVQKFLIEQNIGRFTGGDAAHSIGGPANWLFYVIILLVGFAPWSFWLPKAWPRRAEGTDSAGVLRRYCLIWALVVVVFFSISGAKLPHYIAPALPPLAIIVGTFLARRNNQRAIPLGPAVACGVVAILANVAFWIYYHGATLGQTSIPGFHEEVHDLTRWIKAQGGDVAVYQMSRREKELGTGQVKLRETAHPSLLFYLDKNVLDTDDIQKLLNAPKPVWIITRWNRITDDDRKAITEARQHLESPETPTRQDLYRVYRLTK